MRPLGKKQEAFLIFACFVLTMFAHSSLLLAQETQETESSIQQTVEKPAEFKDFREPEEKIDWRVKERQQFLQNIKAEIRGSEKELFDLNSHMQETEGRLDHVHEEITTLSEQLANLDNKIQTTEQLISNTARQVQEKENEIILLYSDIDQKNAEIENQKRMLTEYLQMLYMQESAVTNTLTRNSEINISKLLLSNEPVADQLQKIKYFNILEETGHDIFTRLEILLEELEQAKERAKLAKYKLSQLYARLEEERSNLEIQREAKQTLLDQTRGEESIYQGLIEESREQQGQIQKDLMDLRDNLGFIQDEMSALGDRFNPDDYRDLFSGEKTSIYQYINAFKDDVEGFSLHWPVEPKRGISAYFRDASYVAVFGVGHNAIDVPTSQGTTIRAPAEGVVYKVRDNGYGYSYLILAHKGGYTTVYGHVSGFLVESGEKVRAGQAIALSGATPGTKGAGYMTTGAHLHFEVMKGGKYIDPLFFLPLAALDYNSLPQKYQDIADEQNRKVARVVPTN